VQNLLALLRSYLCKLCESIFSTLSRGFKMHKSCKIFPKLNNWERDANLRLSVCRINLFAFFKKGKDKKRGRKKIWMYEIVHKE